jgi:hypothetical protein
LTLLIAATAAVDRVSAFVPALYGRARHPAVIIPAGLLAAIGGVQHAVAEEEFALGKISSDEALPKTGAGSSEYGVSLPDVQSNPFVAANKIIEAQKAEQRANLAAANYQAPVQNLLPPDVDEFNFPVIPVLAVSAIVIAIVAYFISPKDKLDEAFVTQCRENALKLKDGRIATMRRVQEMRDSKDPAILREIAAIEAEMEAQGI